MKTYKSSGVRFNVVNELPTKTRNTLLKTVNEFIQGKNDFSRLDNILEYIAGGACGRVYDLGEGFILKVNKFGWRTDTPDGDILKDLQGVAFIPKLYWYSEDNRFIVVQKIDGVTTGNYHGEFLFQKKWEQKAFENMVEKAVEDMKERGWFPCDIHGGNCMIDRQGNFWIVDVGLFRKADSEGYLGCGDRDLLWEGERIGNWHNDRYDEMMASRGVA